MPDSQPQPDPTDDELDGVEKKVEDARERVDDDQDDRYPPIAGEDLEVNPPM